MRHARTFTLAEFVGGPLCGDRRVLEGAPIAWRFLGELPPLIVAAEPGEPTAFETRPEGEYRCRGTARFTVTREFAANIGTELHEHIRRFALPCKYSWEGWL